MCRSSEECEECEYIPHLHAYSVKFGYHLSLVKQRDLHDYYPLPIYEAGDMSLISIRHYVPLS